MLESMVGTLDYKNYMIFVGTYRNDERTKNEVERMRRRYRQLVRVEVPHDGPTCKADCLNWIVQAIFQQNTLQPEPFAGVILHDSEDVLHPLDRKSTRLNSSHLVISYAVFCLKKQTIVCTPCFFFFF